MSYFKTFQAFLFVGVSLVTFVFTFFLGQAFFDYFPLSSEAKATIFQWEVLDRDGRFPVRASYSFEADGKIWKNSFILSKPWHWNQFAAIDQIKEKAKESWTVWYDPHNPSLSVLEKSFPYNLLFRALVCYGVSGYLLWLFYRKSIRANG